MFHEISSSVVHDRANLELLSGSIRILTLAT
jgi:hypothetical protein